MLADAGAPFAQTDSGAVIPGASIVRVGTVVLLDAVQPLKSVTVTVNCTVAVPVAWNETDDAFAGLSKTPFTIDHVICA